MIQYTLTASFISVILSNDIALDVSDLIDNGEFVCLMIKPLNSLLSVWAKDFGEVLAAVVTEALLIIAVFGGLVGFQDIDILRGLQFLLIIVLAYSFSAMLYINLGCLAFIFESVRPFNTCMSYLVSVFGGSYFPITFYPKAVLAVIDYLPFKYLFNYPVMLLLNQAPPGSVIVACATLLAWTLALVALFLVIYKRTVSRISIYGV
jgi:ABC-2 type transport system permease protein